MRIRIPATARPYSSELRELLSRTGCPASKKTVNWVFSSSKSPYMVARNALSAEIPEGNTLEHSYNVFRYALETANLSSIHLDGNKHLVLLYAALLHDIAKTHHKGHIAAIENCLGDACSLYAEKGPNGSTHTDHDIDHGVRSAHYVDYLRRLSSPLLRVYPLDEADVGLLLAIIAMHASGRFHTCYHLPDGAPLGSLRLALAFWLADNADHGWERSRVSGAAPPTNRTDKTTARAGTESVSITRDTILWTPKKGRSSAAVKKSAAIADAGIAMHRPHLKALGLPYTIKCGVRVRRHYDLDARKTTGDELQACGFSQDAKTRTSPLSISEDSFAELYERVVAAFASMPASGRPTGEHYFSPVILEVRYAADDPTGVFVRNKHGRTFEQIGEYARTWLSAEAEANRAFSFGYTHGQRLWDYRYPKDNDDLDRSKRPQDWHGRIDQMEYVAGVLRRHGRSSRRSFAVIWHPLVDHPLSWFAKHDEPERMAPALLAVHFLIEKDFRLSAFALMRAQELSTFLPLNYLELTSMLRGLLAKLRRRPGKRTPCLGRAVVRRRKPLRLGRVVMMSSLAYFDPETHLLDRPKVCREKPANIRDLANVGDASVRARLVDYLGDYKSQRYILVETDWLVTLLDCQFTPTNEGRNAKTELAKLLKKLLAIRGRVPTGGIPQPGDLEEKETTVDKSIARLKSIYNDPK